MNIKRSISLTVSALLGLSAFTALTPIGVNADVEPMLLVGAQATNVINGSETTYWVDNGSNSGIIAAEESDNWVLRYQPASEDSPAELTLRDFTYEGKGSLDGSVNQTSAVLWIQDPDGLTISFEGDNTLINTGNSYFSQGISDHGTSVKLNFKGEDDATLRIVSGPDNVGASVVGPIGCGSITLDGGTLIADGSVNSYNFGVSLYGDDPFISVTRGNIIIKSTSEAIYRESSPTIGAKILTASTNTDGSDPVDFDPENLSGYRYLELSPLDAGDVDGNNVVDGRDASAVLTHYALISTQQSGCVGSAFLSFADYDGNGIIDGRDASAILTYYAQQSVNQNN